MAVRGITKVRNEAHIIEDTLDNWAQWCDAGIHVYCDDCTDRGSTATICKGHDAVVEVIESDLYDTDRERAEWFHRRQVLHSALRFCNDDDWIVYFDGDEHLEQFDAGLLNDPETKAIACESYDTYITPEDEEHSLWHYDKREWVSQEYEFSPYFYRASLPLDFWKPDQRNMDLPKGVGFALHGKVRHWGKGLSVEHWDQKCDYYAEIFGPKYAAKWASRRGNAVKEDMKSDFGFPLVKWEDVLSGKAGGEHCRNRMKLVR